MVEDVAIEEKDLNITLKELDFTGITEVREVLAAKSTR